MARELETDRSGIATGAAVTHEHGAEKAFDSAEHRWRERVAGQDIPPAKTSSGLELDVLYTPESLRDNDPLTDVGLPGEYPFTRGVQPTMYRVRLWTVGQDRG